MKRKPSEAQIWLMDYFCEKHRVWLCETEFQFDPLRKWRFDFAVRTKMWAFEIEGGIYSRIAGAHVRGKHYESDMEKYNVAAARGWKVFRFTPEQVLRGDAKTFIERFL